MGATVVIIVIIFLVVSFLASSLNIFVLIPEENVGVVTTFGKYKGLCKNKITYVDLLGKPGMRIGFFLPIFLLLTVLLIFLFIVGQWNWQDTKGGIIFIGICLCWGLWNFLLKQSNTVEFDFKNKIICIKQNRPILPLVHIKVDFNHLNAIELVIIPTEHIEYFSLRLKSSSHKSITFGFFKTQSEAFEQICFLKKKIKI